MLYSVLLFGLLLTILALGVSLCWDRGGDKLQQLRQSLERADSAPKPASGSGGSLLRDDLLSGIPVLNRWLGQRQDMARLRRWLQQAGVDLRPGKFLLILLAAGLAAGLLALSFASGPGFLLAFAAGAALPYGVLARRRTRRLAAFRAQFPGAIDLLVRASRAGHPPSTTFELVAKEMPDPVAGEFRQVFDQQRFGLPLRDCLLNLAERVPMVDVQFFAIALVIQRESGGNLAEILEKLASLIRERVQLQRQVKTHTAQGRMTLWVLMGLAPLLLLTMLWLSRAFVMPLFTDPMGRALLMLAAGLQMVGLVLLRKIVELEV